MNSKIEKNGGEGGGEAGEISTILIYVRYFEEMVYDVTSTQRNRCQEGSSVGGEWVQSGKQKGSEIEKKRERET